MFGISGTEFTIIAVLAFLLLGPEKLPELLRTFTKFWREFNQTRERMEQTVRAELYTLDPDSEEPSTPASAAEAVSRLPKIPQATVIPDDDEEGDEE